MRSVLLTIIFYYVELEQSYLKHKKFWQRAAIFNKSLNQLFTVKINYLLQIRILWITSCPCMPSKKVIGELVSKKMPRLSFMCIKKTTQIQGNSACGIVQNHFNEVRVLLWIYTAVKKHSIGAPPMISYAGAIQKNSIQSMPFCKCETRI